MGEVSKFFGRHVGASLIGAMGVILAALGFADQADAIATRFEPWQLQALGAAFFVTFVVKVLISFDQKHQQEDVAVRGSVQATEKPLKPSASAFKATRDKSQAPPNMKPTARLDPDTVPASVAQQYRDLKLSNHTSLQEKRFLQPYVGKWIELDLVLAKLEPDGGQIRALLFHEDGRNQCSGVFAHFDSKWEDHLEQIKRRENLHFRGRVNIDKSGWISFVDAEPL